MNIDLSKLGFDFKHKPLLVSGMALKYYKLRDSSKDIDMILHEEDHKDFARSLKDQATILKEDPGVSYKDKPLFVDLYGDHGILIYEFELWDSIGGYDYKNLSENAVEEKDYLVINLEKHMFLSTLRGIDKKRYLEDALLIGGEILKRKYRNFKHEKNKHWKDL
jgi:hypothetical protein